MKIYVSNASTQARTLSIRFPERQIIRHDISPGGQIFLGDLTATEVDVFRDHAQRYGYQERAVNDTSYFSGLVWSTGEVSAGLITDAAESLKDRKRDKSKERLKTGAAAVDGIMSTSQGEIDGKSKLRRTELDIAAEPISQSDLSSNDETKLVVER